MLPLGTTGGGPWKTTGDATNGTLAGGGGGRGTETVGTGLTSLVGLARTGPPAITGPGGGTT